MNINTVFKFLLSWGYKIPFYNFKIAFSITFFFLFVVHTKVSTYKSKNLYSKSKPMFYLTGHQS
jgi:hypothetical protein